MGCLTTAALFRLMHKHFSIHTLKSFSSNLLPISSIGIVYRLVVERDLDTDEEDRLKDILTQFNFGMGVLNIMRLEL